MQGLALDGRRVGRIRRVSNTGRERPRAVRCEAALLFSEVSDGPFAAIAFVVSFSHQKRDKLPFDVADGSLRSRGQEVTDCSVEIELHRGRVCLGGGGHVSSSRRGRYVVTVYCRYEKTSNGDRFELGIGVSG